MATKTTAEKLAVKPGNTVWISDRARTTLIGDLPAGASYSDDPTDANVAILLADDAATARKLLAEHKPALLACPIVWIAYPKANKTDINRDTLWPLAYEIGLRPNSQVAIDETWSGLRFRALKEGEEFNPSGKK